jgi:hypothetical protein
MIVQSVLRFLKRIWVAPQDPSSPSGGYWSSTPVEVSEDNPLPVDVSHSDPLILGLGGRSHMRVWVGNDWGSPIPTEPSNIDILLVGDVASVGYPAKDLLGSTDAETPTITQATPYKRFILYFFTNASSGTNAYITVTLKGRATTTSGVPLNINWVTLYTSGISTSGQNWYRVVLQASDGAPLGGDQYRIELTSTVSSTNNTAVSQTISFSLKGER